ncbi:exostosin-2 [Orussus abietinus]|uniref:exostosin-2 n=1 Tax=Orussus abietinus TaxID=222816 RepID=UPI000626DE89|nr:exostosin-2 [Orussus abietinus]
MAVLFLPCRRSRKDFSDWCYIVVLLSMAMVLLIILTITYRSITFGNSQQNTFYAAITLNDIESLPTEVLRPDLPLADATNLSCTHFNCFNVYHCGSRGNKLLVYVYPLKTYVDETGKPITGQMSKEFYLILEAVVNSEFYTPNPHEACVFVPSIDTLNRNRLREEDISRALKKLEFWNKGKNHLLFNMIPGFAPNYNSFLNVPIGEAMLAGAGLSSMVYRTGFDISLPVYSTLLMETNLNSFEKRKWLLISSQINTKSTFEHDLFELQTLFPNEIAVLCPCLHHNPINYSIRCIGEDVYKYPDVLHQGSFCLILGGARLGQSLLLESLATGCIPVIIADSLIMPFHDVIEWTKAAVFIPEVDILSVVTVLKKISPKRVTEFREQGTWLYERYFKTIEKITLTTLEILADRVFPHLARDYIYWNELNRVGHMSPIFVPVTAPKTRGFTAVILTYDRIELLFLLINKIVKVPSLSKVLVIWNNQHKDPPHPSSWPKVMKPLKVIQTKENKLSNRFYPYSEIETEAILSIDDDIIMLTVDEVEFAYEVWREFPDRIVGFPSRTHAWDNVSNCWKYESEWTNRISMVLTGAAFHHKYWSYMYTTALPGDIKNWVDEHMNCEDIAMNFLVANLSGKAPIKVTPKKKFRCPECTNTEMLSADLTHMIERTQCINRFSAIYGSMPLQSVEFRADPVLFKDVFPEKLKRFNDIGSL